MPACAAMTDELLDIPGYQVHGRLGKGGMAEVYLATQQSLQRKVAIKVLLSADDQDFCQRFIKEGHIVAGLHHPSIITIYDIDQLADGRYYLAMEFISGGDLAQRKGHVFEPQQALRIVRQIASGLAVVHERGLVHRDIKPANILFRADGTAVITDFGVAKEVQLDSDLTQFGIAVGSPAYSSPEQAQCLPLDARSDIYSLGVILLEMLTGTNPYRGSNYTQTVMNHVQMDVPQLPAVLQDYQWLLERMLAKDPDARFADCRVLLSSLDELSEADQDSTRIAPAVRVGGRKPGGLAPWTWLLIALVLLGGMSAGGYYAYQQVRINHLLAQAELQLQQGNLQGPQQDNADYLFRQVLLLDADNPQALEGLGRVLQLRLQNYLMLAEERLQDGRWLLPEDDSAAYYFRQVLAWEPDHLLALAGLERLAQRYVQQAEEAYGRREFALALTSIQQGLELSPENQALLQLAAGHEQRVRSAQVVRTPSRPRPANAPAQQPPANPVKRLWNSIFKE